MPLSPLNPDFWLKNLKPAAARTGKMIDLQLPSDIFTTPSHPIHHHTHPSNPPPSGPSPLPLLPCPPPPLLPESPSAFQRGKPWNKKPVLTSIGMRNPAWTRILRIWVTNMGKTEINPHIYIMNMGEYGTTHSYLLDEFGSIRANMDCSTHIQLVNMYKYG